MSTGRRACARLAEVSTSGKVGKVIHALFGNAHVATRGNPGIQSVAVGGSRASNVMKVINQRPIWRIPGRSEPCLSDEHATVAHLSLSLAAEPSPRAFRLAGSPSTQGAGMEPQECLERAPPLLPRRAGTAKTR